MSDQAFDPVAFAEYLRKLGPVDTMTIVDPNSTKEKPVTAFAAVVPDGRELTSLAPFLDEFRLIPRRKIGTAIAASLDSFVALTNHARIAESVLFAKPDKASPTLTAVVNYHEKNAGEPRFGDHRVHYAFPVSPEWQKWTGYNGKQMGQADFAAFLEDRILDIMEPPNIQTADPAVDSVLELANKLGGSFAGPTRLMELSRGMTVNVEAKVGANINISSGEATINFEEQHVDAKGAPLKVPSLFLILIPVFDRGPAYRVAVRLRYRKDGHRLIWWYQLYQPEKSFDHAFAEACTFAQEQTTLPLFEGAP